MIYVHCERVSYVNHCALDYNMIKETFCWNDQFWKL